LPELFQITPSVPKEMKKISRGYVFSRISIYLIFLLTFFLGSNVSVALGFGPTLGGEGDNNPPIANNDSYRVNDGVTLTVGVTRDVLVNDSDPDGDLIKAVLVSGPSNGRLDFCADGSFSYCPDPGFTGTDSFTYMPDPGFTGTDSFTYTSNDGNLESNEAKVTLKVHHGIEDKVGTLWAPYIEWSLENPTYTGNPYDLIAKVTFIHEDSGETRVTEMFYDGGTIWKFRFTGTRVGVWTFTTSSSDVDLAEHNGKVTIRPNTNAKIKGFVVGSGARWGRMGSDEVFVPQYVMYASPSAFYDNPIKIDTDIELFLEQHGFTGFHLMGTCHWFDIYKQRSDEIDSNDPNPDPRTFEAFELLITKVHQAGGVVHIWMWGDESRLWTPKRWGINGTVDRRLQRYLSARLGPLPGWTMGYGFDIIEWVTIPQLDSWYNYMHEHLGWPHILGGRAPGPRFGTDHSNYIVWNIPMDYSGYEHHKPTYEVYIAALSAIPGKPVFSEDRFRVRGKYPNKDYDFEETRRGLWISTLAGGVANIWGNLASQSSQLLGSEPYPNSDQIKTYSLFFRERFMKDLSRNHTITDGVALKSSDNRRYIFYKEDTSSIQMDLSIMVGAQKAIAVDTKLPYAEIKLGLLSNRFQSWSARYVSDWAIAVGDFNRVTANDPLLVDAGSDQTITLPDTDNLDGSHTDGGVPAAP